MVNFILRIFFVENLSLISLKTLTQVIFLAFFFIIKQGVYEFKVQNCLFSSCSKCVHIAKGEILTLSFINLLILWSLIASEQLGKRKKFKNTFQISSNEHLQVAFCVRAISYCFLPPY